MNINKSKITKGNNEVEIINVKLPEEDIKQLLNSSGYYKAYHMNKKNWITIILDDTINDEKIMDYINKSYLLVEKK
jgi:predicted DNA-binding protein (MmcQ/YjbR family)